MPSLRRLLCNTPTRQRANATPTNNNAHTQLREALEARTCELERLSGGYDDAARFLAACMEDVQHKIVTVVRTATEKEGQQADGGAQASAGPGAHEADVTIIPGACGMGRGGLAWCGAGRVGRGGGRARQVEAGRCAVWGAATASSVWAWRGRDGASGGACVVWCTR